MFGDINYFPDRGQCEVGAGCMQGGCWDDLGWMWGGCGEDVE